MSNPAQIHIEQLVEALLDLDNPLPAKFVYRLSDITTEDLSALAKRWPEIPTWRRQALLEDVELIGDEDTLLDFEAFFLFLRAGVHPFGRGRAQHAAVAELRPGRVRRAVPR